MKKPSGAKARELYRQYLSTLKPLAVEGWPDLFFFRPLAFGLIKGLRPWNLTPNQISGCALLTGLIASAFLTLGDPLSLKIAAGFYCAMIVFDCADGMLARLYRNGTVYGRIIDGIVDYVNGLLLFSGLAIMASRGGVHYLLPGWLLALMAMLSMILHSSLVDYYRGQFQFHALGQRHSPVEECTTWHAQLDVLKTQRGAFFKKILLGLYLTYARWQSNFTTTTLKHEPHAYYHYNYWLLRGWLGIDQSMHYGVLMVALIAGHPGWFLFYSIVLANGWVVAMLMFQRQADALLDGIENSPAFPHRQGEPI